jgi:hypothetical protein
MTINYAKSANVALHENRNYSYINVAKSYMRSTEKIAILFLLIISVSPWVALLITNPGFFIAQPVAIFPFAVTIIATEIATMQWGMDAAMSYVRQHMFREVS